MIESLKIQEPTSHTSYLLSKQSVSLMISRYRLIDQTPSQRDWHFVFYHLKYQQVLQCHLTDIEYQSLEKYCTSTNLITFKFVIIFCLMTKRFDRGLMLYYYFKTLKTDVKLTTYVTDYCTSIPQLIKDKLWRQSTLLEFPDSISDPNNQILRRPDVDKSLIGLTEGTIDNGNRVFQFSKAQDPNMSQISISSFKNQSILSDPPLTPKRRLSRTPSQYTSPNKHFNEPLLLSDVTSLNSEEPQSPKSPKRSKTGLSKSPRSPVASLLNMSFKKDPIPSPHSEFVQESKQHTPRKSVFANDSDIVYSSRKRPSSPRPLIEKPSSSNESSPLKNKSLLESEPPLKRAKIVKEVQETEVKLAISSQLDTADIELQEPSETDIIDTVETDPLEGTPSSPSSSNVSSESLNVNAIIETKVQSVLPFVTHYTESMKTLTKKQLMNKLKQVLLDIHTSLRSLPADQQTSCWNKIAIYWPYEISGVELERMALDYKTKTPTKTPKRNTAPVVPTSSIRRSTRIKSKSELNSVASSRPASPVPEMRTPSKATPSRTTSTRSLRSRK